MSRKRNIKKEMFQPMTECINSLAIDDITGQAIPEPGTGRTECSVADVCVECHVDTYKCCANSVFHFME